MKSFLFRGHQSTPIRIDPLRQCQCPSSASTSPRINDSLPQCLSPFIVVYSFHLHHHKSGLVCQNCAALQTSLNWRTQPFPGKSAAYHTLIWASWYMFQRIYRGGVVLEPWKHSTPTAAEIPLSMWRWVGKWNTIRTTARACVGNLNSILPKVPKRLSSVEVYKSSYET